MSGERQVLSIASAIEVDEALAEIHALMVKELLAGRATPVIEQAEQMLHDLRNQFAGLTGLGFKFAVCEGELV